MGLVYFALLITIFFSVWLLWSELQVAIARRQGIYPPKSKVTMDAVKELSSKGEKILAIRAYRELTGASLVEAKKVVNDMEKLAR